MTQAAFENPSYTRLGDFDANRISLVFAAQVFDFRGLERGYKREREEE